MLRHKSRRHLLWDAPDADREKRYQFIRKQGSYQIRRVLDRKGTQTKVEGIALQHLQSVGREPGFKFHLKLRMVRFQLSQNRGQQIHEYGHACTDTNSSKPTIIEAPHRHMGAVVFFQQVARVFDQFLAGLSEVSSLTEPLDERNVEAPLQLLDLMRHGRLRQV